MSKILIIGGAGYVGTVLTTEFLKKGYSVTILDNFIYDNQFAITPFIGDPKFEIIKGNMGDEEVLYRASQGVDHVVLLAGLVGDPITKKYPDKAEEINEKELRQCINYFDDKDIEKLIFISTCSNYGLISENELADENFKLKPLSLYAKAKVAAEKHILSKKGLTKYSGTVLRFATAFGLSPRMRFDLTISEFTRDLFFGEKLVVFDEHTWRPYCHLRDFARLIDIVIGAEKEKVDFEIFNAGGDRNNFTKKMVVDSIAEKLPDSKIVYNQNDSDPRNYRVSFEKVRTVLGFEPDFSVNDGIKELIEALNLGLFADSLEVKEKYGNYFIKQ